MTGGMTISPMTKRIRPRRTIARAIPPPWPTFARRRRACAIGSIEKARKAAARTHVGQQDHSE